MFPGANSVVYYNEDGEPLGWDTVYEGEYDDDFYDDDFYDYGEDD